MGGTEGDERNVEAVTKQEIKYKFKREELEVYEKAAGGRRQEPAKEV